MSQNSQYLIYCTVYWGLTATHISAPCETYVNSSLPHFLSIIIKTDTVRKINFPFVALPYSMLSNNNMNLYTVIPPQHLENVGGMVRIPQGLFPIMNYESR